MERRASPWLDFATTVSASFVAALALTIVTGWGSDDLGAFLFWTVPFAGVLAIDLAADATDEERRRARLALEQSPLVEHVEE
jgi:hypothetical protein